MAATKADDIYNLYNKSKIYTRPEGKSDIIFTCSAHFLNISFLCYLTHIFPLLQHPAHFGGLTTVNFTKKLTLVI